MQEAVAVKAKWSWSVHVRTCAAALVFLACLHSLLAQTASNLGGGFREGLSFSQTRPLTIEQQTGLLKDLRRLTGFVELESDDAGFLVLGNRAHLLGGSPTARALISAVVDGRDSYVLEGHYRSPAVAFARIQARLDYVNLKTAPPLTRQLWSVEIDFYDFKELRGGADAITAFDPALTLLHELAHAVLHLRDSTSETDSLGDCERYINLIRNELGLPQRLNYEAMNKQAVTPYGTSQRVLGEIGFARIDPGKGMKKSRLTFDVENVFAARMAPAGGRPR